MQVHIYQENSDHRVEEREPVCGDYCSECGDCLTCHAEDDCGGTPGAKHRWEILEPGERKQ